MAIKQPIVSTNTMASSLDAVAFVALGAYIGLVLYNGNIKSLGSAVIKDGPGFVEFLIALYIVIWLANLPGSAGKIFSGLFALAILGVVFRIMQGPGVDAFNQFGSGQIGIFGLISRLAKG